MSDDTQDEHRGMSPEVFEALLEFFKALGPRMRRDLNRARGGFTFEEVMEYLNHLEGRDRRNNAADEPC